MSRVGSWLLALGGGAVWALCFERQPLTVASWLVLVPLLLLLRQPRPAWLGFLHGVAFWVVAIPWIIPTVVSFGQLPTWLAVLSFLALCCYLALFQALFAGLAARFWCSGAIAAVVGIPALWVLIERLRSYLFSGFPWNLAGYAWLDMPGALQLSSWVGIYGISFLLVMSNTGLALALSHRSWRQAAVVVGFCLLVLGLGGRYGDAAVATKTAAADLAVRVLQPNTGIVTVGGLEQIEENYRLLLEQSWQACDYPGALLIWPESAAWPFSYSRDERIRNDLQSLAEAGCVVLLNSSRKTAAGIFNSVLLVDDTGVLGRYDKRHLVPFGEYVPMASRLPFLKRIARGAGEFLTGEEVITLPWGKERLGPAICFEITFPEEVVEHVQHGASILITVTNDAWYGDSSAPWQHYRAARFRAAENRRYLLRAALTGVSTVVEPNGVERARLGVGERGVLATRVSGRSDSTLYSKRPWLVPVLCLVALCFAIFISRKESRHDDT